jgi:hypothetical protein
MGEQISAPVGPKPAGDLSIGNCRPQFSFTAIVVGWRIGMCEKLSRVKSLPERSDQRSFSASLR